MYDSDINAFNFTTSDNNVTIKFCSSAKDKCKANNILSNERKSLWVSEQGVPQTIILNLTKMKKNPKGLFKYWGIYCWHAFSTNPKKIEIDVSEDNNSYTYIGDYEIRLKPGTQFFTIEQNLYKKVKKINYIKVIIKETYGDSGESRTYINQIFFFDESANLEQDNNEVSNTEEQSYKEEDEEMSYQPIAPMKEVKKLITSENESSERIATNQILNESDDNEEEEMKVTTDNNIETEENPEEDITENEEEKEKKLRKIQKILKSKIKNPIRNIKSSPYVNKTYQEQGNIDQYLTENTNEISNHNQTSIVSNIKRPQISSRLATRGKNLFFSNQNTIGESYTTTIRPYTPSLTPHTITYANIQRRTLTPLKPISKTIYNSPVANEAPLHIGANDSEYQKLENQLKEIDEHLKAMNGEGSIESAKNMIHSKSFSFLPKETINSNPQSNLTPYIKEDSNKFEVNDFPLQSDSRSEFRTILPSSNRIVEHEKMISGLPSSLPLSGKNEETININQERIKGIESKIENLEVEIRQIKLDFEQFAKDIKTFITDISQQPKENNIQNTEEIINVVLEECAKMISSKFNEYQPPNTHNSNYQNNMISNQYQYTGGNISTDSNLNSFEARLNKKIEEKFDILANNIENQVFKDFLQPSIQQIEVRMKENMDEIKDKLNNLNNNTNIVSQSENTSFIDSYRMNRSIRSSMNEGGKTSTQRKEEKYDEINKIGEKLYNKLVEKEKKLQDLKKETSNYLKKKLKSDEKRYSKTNNNS